MSQSLTPHEGQNLEALRHNPGAALAMLAGGLAEIEDREFEDDGSNTIGDHVELSQHARWNAVWRALRSAEADPDESLFDTAARLLAQYHNHSHRAIADQTRNAAIDVAQEEIAAREAGLTAERLVQISQILRLPYTEADMTRLLAVYNALPADVKRTYAREYATARATMAGRGIAGALNMLTQSLSNRNGFRPEVPYTPLVRYILESSQARGLSVDQMTACYNLGAQLYARSLEQK